MTRLPQRNDSLPSCLIIKAQALARDYAHYILLTLHFTNWLTRGIADMDTLCCWYYMLHNPGFYYYKAQNIPLLLQNPGFYLWEYTFTMFYIQFHIVQFCEHIHTHLQGSKYCSSYFIIQSSFCVNIHLSNTNIRPQLFKLLHFQHLEALKKHAWVSIWHYTSGGHKNAFPNMLSICVIATSFP